MGKVAVRKGLGKWGFGVYVKVFYIYYTKCMVLMFDDAWCMHIYVRETERDRESTAPLTRISTSHFLKSNFTLFAASYYKQIWTGCKIRTEFIRPLPVKESFTTLGIWHIAVLGNTHRGATSTSWVTNIFCYQFHRTSVIQKSWLINNSNTPCTQDIGFTSVFVHWAKHTETLIQFDFSYHLFLGSVTGFCAHRNGHSRFIKCRTVS